MDSDWLMNSGFYKNENEQILYGPNYVLNMDYELYKESKNENIYPVDGWYWFDSEEEAYEFFGIKLITEEPIKLLDE